MSDPTFPTLISKKWNGFGLTTLKIYLLEVEPYGVVLSGIPGRPFDLKILFLPNFTLPVVLI